MPQPNPALLTSVDNRLLREARAFDMNKSRIQHQELYPQLNPEQRLIYEEVVDSVHNKKGQFHFVYRPGGTRKTFLYKTIISRLRSELKIVLAVASSGIASLLLPGGRTAHSKFVIPLELLENSTCLKEAEYMSNMYEDPIYDEVGTSYDSSIPSEVQDQDNYSDNVDGYSQEHEMQSNVQHNYVVNSDADYTSDSNIILYDQYMEDNEEHVVQSNVSSARNDALMSIIDDMYE
ncbi:ATP-dependent DNA helicase PIF1-like protein [Tanacetum coccineum]